MKPQWLLLCKSPKIKKVAQSPNNIRSLKREWHIISALRLLLLFFFFFWGVDHLRNSSHCRGRSRNFIGGGGGGGRKRFCAGTHITSAKPNLPYTAGSRGRLRALEALGFFDALSCYLSLIFKHSDTKWAKTTTTIAPSKSATVTASTFLGQSYQNEVSKFSEYD